ncbi:MAG: hypothetical protein ACTHOJ_17665 [Sphingomonas oligoaromativorans]
MMDEEKAAPIRLDAREVFIRIELLEGLLADLVARTLNGPGWIDRWTEEWNRTAEVTIASRGMTDTETGMMYQRLSDALLAKVRAAAADRGSDDAA